MKFKIEEPVLEKFPGLRIGILTGKDINNAGINEEISSKNREIEKEAREKFSLETLVNEPKINDWRQAYASFGAKPKTYKNSVEALMRRILKGDSLPGINKVVDIYNSISVKHALPAGGDDIDKINGDIVLTIAKGGEPFTVLGSMQEETAEEGEVIYRDDKEVLCRRWNWRECDKTKMTEETKSICLVIEALKSTTIEELETALNELKDNIERYCGGATETHILGKDRNSILIH